MKYIWKKNAKIGDVKAHIRSLEAAIAYFKNRNRIERVAELEEELNDLKKFYNIV